MRLIDKKSAEWWRSLPLDDRYVIAVGLFCLLLLTLAP